MATEILTPEGRIVEGHPMRQSDGATSPTESLFSLAISKGAETDWRQTDWGSKIFATGKEAWLNGEYDSTAFEWNIVDGDSHAPDKDGVKPSSNDGYAGHWVINMVTGAPIRCFHSGHYQAHEVIQNEKEIKAGDYGRAFIKARGNNQDQSPGVHISPDMFELTRQGETIVSAPE